MAADYGREVVLEGEERDRAESARAGLEALGRLVADTVEGSSGRQVELADAEYTYAAGTLIVHGPEYCNVYDGDAGVCRPCTPEEEAG